VQVDDESEIFSSYHHKPRIPSFLINSDNSKAIAEMTRDLEAMHTLMPKADAQQEFIDPSVFGASFFYDARQ
jgi:hypothetical protein